jgi:hypothetical protein
VGTRASTWKELERDVVANGGLLTVTGEDLRRIYGAERLGSTIRKEIRKELAGRELAIDGGGGDFYQENLLRLYKRGTAAAEIIDAVNTIGEHHDETIRTWLEGDSGKLARIQEILRS